MKKMKIKKYIKKKCGKGFTFLVVPNSPGAVRSFAIPFSAALLIFGIVVFNIYIFVGYTTQIWQIQKFRNEIRVKNARISKLEKEQREVQPTLKRSYEIAAELSRLKVEREKLLNSWKAIQQKGGRVVSATTSRGVVNRPRPYTINQIELNSSGVKTDLMELQNNLAQIDEFIKTEKDLQRELLNDFIAYETKLDHTPSIWPVSSYIISRFGTRFHPVHKRYITHTGVDLKAHYTSVKAAADGVVEFSGYQGGYGYVVIINHGYGYKTLYAHNSKLLVTKGQKVKKGQKVSISGNTGVSTGPHLHYEVRINNVPVNPVMFLKN